MDDKAQTPIQNAVSTLKQAAANFTTEQTENLIRADLGIVGFSDLKEDIDSLVKFARRVKNCAWSGVPLPVLQTATAKFNQLQAVCARMQSFNPKSSANITYEINQYASDFRGGWGDVYNYICPHLVFAESQENLTELQTTAIESALKELDLAKETLKKEVSNISGTIEEDRNRMKTLTQEIEHMARRSGVTDQALHFKELADSYVKGAVAWGVGVLIFGFLLFFYVKDLQLGHSDTMAGAFEEAVPRVISVTLLSTGLIFCIKNFSAMMHNVIVNRHRQTALTTFTTFVNSTDDLATKNAVLVQSTQAIFAPQPSGYLKADTEMPQMSQITEIVRGIASKDQ